MSAFIFSLSNTFFLYFVETNDCFHCLDYSIFSRKLKIENELLNVICTSLLLLSENIFRTTFFDLVMNCIVEIKELQIISRAFYQQKNLMINFTFHVGNKSSKISTNNLCTIIRYKIFTPLNFCNRRGFHLPPILT